MEALVTFIVRKGTEMLDGEVLMDFSREKLPQYMLPSAVESVDKPPLTADGKVDRKALIDGRLSMLEEQKPQLIDTERSRTRRQFFMTYARRFWIHRNSKKKMVCLL